MNERGGDDIVDDDIDEVENDEVENDEDAVVADDDLGKCFPHDVRETAESPGPDRGTCKADIDDPVFIVHGVGGVDTQIDQDLVDLRRIS